jgi:hypothetical protein
MYETAPAEIVTRGVRAVRARVLAEFPTEYFTGLPPFPK